MDPEQLKALAARAALDEVRSGMRLGLGTGSTVLHFLEQLGRALRESRLQDISGVPTSEQTRQRAQELGIPVLDLGDAGELDLAIDGADEIDPGLDLVKGHGGALLREKMVASASRRFVVIADSGKRVIRLGEKKSLPVEVVTFAWEWHLPYFRSLGAEPSLRRDRNGEPVRTDNGNYVIDCLFRPHLPEPGRIANELDRRVGIVEHGLFLGCCARVYLASPSGVEVLSRETRGDAG